MPSPSTTHRYVVPPRGRSRPPGDRRVGADERATRGESLVGEEVRRQRAVVDDGMRVDERELHRLDRRVLARLEAVVEREREQRGRALAVRRQLAHLDAAVRAAEWLDPLRAMGEQIVLREPARRRDRRRDLPLVQSRRPARLDPAKRGSEIGKRVALAESPGRGHGARLRLRPLVGDARAAREAGLGELGSRADRLVEPEPAEPRRKVVPQAHGTRHGDRARPVVGPPSCGRRDRRVSGPTR